MAQMRPGFLVGGEARYLRKYEGIGLQEFAGQDPVRWSYCLFPALGALPADASLERPGMGAFGAIGFTIRSG